MDGQKANLPLQGVIIQLCLLHGFLHRDHNIPQQLGAGVVVNVVHTVLPQREAKYIRLSVNVSIRFVQLTDLFVIHKAHAHLCAALEMLQLQHGVATTADQQPNTGRHLHCLLIV